MAVQNSLLEKFSGKFRRCWKMIHQFSGSTKCYLCQGLGIFRQGKWLLENRPRLRERCWIFSSETATALLSFSEKQLLYGEKGRKTAETHPESASGWTPHWVGSWVLVDHFPGDRSVVSTFAGGYQNTVIAGKQSARHPELVVKFDGEICGGVLVEKISDDFPSKRSSKISFQTSPEVRHQFRRKLRQLHSGNRWCLGKQSALTTHTPLIKGVAVHPLFKGVGCIVAVDCFEVSDVFLIELRLKWPFTEWETGPEQKSRKNGKENGKWPHARNGRKMATKTEKWTQKWDFGLILAIFSISAAIFRPFQAWGHFPFSFPFFRDFCSGPVSQSVNGHFNRNDRGCTELATAGFIPAGVSKKGSLQKGSFHWRNLKSVWSILIDFDRKFPNLWAQEVGVQKEEGAKNLPLEPPPPQKKKKGDPPPSLEVITPTPPGITVWQTPPPKKKKQPPAPPQKKGHQNRSPREPLFCLQGIC